MGLPTILASDYQSQIFSQAKSQPIDTGNIPYEQAINNKNSRFSVILDCLVSKFNVNPVLASNLVQKIFAQQDFINLGQAISFRASDTLPFVLVVTKQRVHCLEKKVGEGTYSNVYQTIVIPTERHEAENVHFSPGKPITAALKATKRAGLQTAFSPEKRLIEDATKGRNVGIDCSLDTFKDTFGTGYSLNILYGHNLSLFEFHKCDKIANGILKVLIGCSEGLATLHDNHYVHRDIKGGNILVSIPASAAEQGKLSDSVILSDEITGVLTDFGFLTLESKERHKTIGTPQYLDPIMFGIEEESLCNQKTRIGIQTKEGDVYALGMTIYRDILLNLIFRLDKKQPTAKTWEACRLVKRLDVKVHQGPFNTDELKRLSTGSNYRMVFNGYVQKANGQIGEEVYENPPIENIRSTLKDALLKLDLWLKAEEIECLIELANLACDMEEVDLIKRPTMSQVHAKLKDLLENLEAKMTRKKKFGIKFELPDNETEEQPKSKRLKEVTEDIELLMDADLFPKPI